VTPNLFTVGGAMLDCIVAADGTLSLGQIGGNAIHAAVGAALMGARAGVVARVPRGWPVAALAGTPLDATGIRQEAAPLPDPEWFFHRPDGSRVDRLHASVAEAASFGIHGTRVAPELAVAWERHLAARGSTTSGYAAFRAAHPVGPEHVPPSWWAARGVHLAPGATAAQLAMARAARAQGLRVTLDPGFTAEGLAPALLEALLAACDLFLPSEKELHALRPGLAPAAALAALARPGGPVLLAKLGGEGALLLDPAEGVPHAIPALRTQALDPTGAGDAFGGAVLAGLLRGETPLRAARRGAVAGSFAVERAGALAPLDVPAAAVAARLAQYAPPEHRSAP
jgi:ribokinase